MAPEGPTICLTMIVRDEAPVIERCLASVAPLIDAWVVVDTGSTDGTQGIVRRALADIPGELIERPWVNFGHNRTEALAYARNRADYALVIDADEVLEVSPEFARSSLTADSLTIETRFGSLTYFRKHLFRNALEWRYEGVLHEHAVCQDAEEREERITGLRVVPRHDGARARDPLTYRRDALALENALLDDPDNPRTVFYLAQSYRDAGDLELAARHYARRVTMEGWRDEAWYSRYQLGQLRDAMDAPWGESAHEFLAAYELDPERAEPLYRLGAHHLGLGEPRAALVYLDAAVGLPTPGPGHLFVDRDLYDYRLKLLHADACGQVARHEQAIAACNALLTGGLLPAGLVREASEIRRRSVSARHPQLQPPPPPDRVVVCVPFRDPDARFDDLVESVLLQEGVDVIAVFIDDGSLGDHTARIPLDRPGFRLVRNAVALGFQESVDAHLAACLKPGDAVVVLPPTVRLASRTVLGHVRAQFGRVDARALYGQHRRPDGTLGTAEPATGEGDFERRLGAAAGSSPVFFRAASWAPGVTTDRLLRTAGFGGTAFTDEVLTIDGEAAEPHPRRPEPADPQAGDALTVSCLMVTRDRVALAKRAIRCYASQTHPILELVVVNDGDERCRLALERYVAELDLPGVRFVHPATDDLPLGELRNVSMAAASGDVWCQWDDDDCSHPDRIRLQLAEMLRKDARACFLTDHLQYLQDDEALVWVDWTLGGRSGREQLLPGTLLMYADDRFRYPEAGPFARRGEDTELLYQLCDTVPVAAAVGVGYLYLYTFHGRNTFDRDHHYRLSMFGRTVDALKRDRGVIAAAMRHYPVAKPYLVIGSDGPAFMLDA